MVATTADSTKTNAELIAGLPATRDELVIKNEPLLWMVAKRLNRPPGIEMEDLVQEGLTVLCKCVDYFDPTRGNEFSTYVCVAVRCRMLRYLNDNWSVIRSPQTSKSARKRYAVERERAARVISIDYLDDGQHVTQSGYHFDPSESDSRIDAEEILSGARSLGILSGREEYVLRQRANGKTLRWLAWQLEVCRERVRQVEQKAIEKLKEMLEEQ